MEIVEEDYMAESILKEILKMEMGETKTFKISDTRFLFVDNWTVGDGEDFTSLELNTGWEEQGDFVLDKILECGTYDFKNATDIKTGIDYMILCSRD